MAARRHRTDIAAPVVRVQDPFSVRGGLPAQDGGGVPAKTTEPGTPTPRATRPHVSGCERRMPAAVSRRDAATAARLGAVGSKIRARLTNRHELSAGTSRRQSGGTGTAAAAAAAGARPAAAPEATASTMRVSPDRRPSALSVATASPPHGCGGYPRRRLCAATGTATSLAAMAACQRAGGPRSSATGQARTSLPAGPPGWRRRRR